MKYKMIILVIKLSRELKHLDLDIVKFQPNLWKDIMRENY